MIKNAETFMPHVWAEKMMHDYMRNMWEKVLLIKEYPNGIRGTYQREIDRAKFAAECLKPVARTSQRSRSPDANPRRLTV